MPVQRINGMCDIPWMIHLDGQQFGDALGAEAGGQVVVQHVAVASSLFRHAPLHKKGILLNGPRRQGGAAHQNRALD